MVDEEENEAPILQEELEKQQQLEKYIGWFINAFELFCLLAWIIALFGLVTSPFGWWLKALLLSVFFVISAYCAFRAQDYLAKVNPIKRMDN